MFITLQFPLFDYRFIKPNPNRTERPNWPEPGKNDRIRYFGEILDRTKPYLGPWDDEKKYCNIRSVLNLCGMDNENFFKMLFSDQSQSRILFRRFQSDGKCMAKFEIGINDHLEQTLLIKKADAATTAAAVYEQVQKYLLCPIRVKVGNKLQPFVPLAAAGDDLNSAYYWATSKGKKSFNEKDIKHESESCEPVLIIQLDISKLDTSKMQMEKVDMPGTNVKLFYQYIPYRIGRKSYNLKTWIIGTGSTDSDTPLLPFDFDNYNQTIRYLRINLLRIHLEINLQKKLVATLSGSNEAYIIKDAATRDRVYFYLHKIWLNLSGINRNKQPQQQLVKTAFSLDQSYFGSVGIDEQINMLAEYKNWLMNLTVTTSNNQVIKYITDNTAGLQQKSAAEAETETVFISYNHADDDIAALIKNKLEEKNIKVILDSASMLAGTPIDSFIISSIKNCNAVLSIVSVNSLTSGWVSIETVNALSLKKFFSEKKFIPCYLDKDFFDNHFVLKAVDIIDTKLDEIEALSKIYAKKKINTSDLDDDKNRLHYLRSNLSNIVQHLKNNLCIDITPGKTTAGINALLVAIKN